MKPHFFIFSMALFAFVGCGGGGSDDSNNDTPPTNDDPPTVTEDQLAFTAEELDGNTVFVIVQDEEDCPTDEVYVEPLSFESGNYTLDLCGDGPLEQGTYSVTEAGSVQIQYNDGNSTEFIRRTSLNPPTGDWLVCWTDIEGASCTSNQQGIVFLSEADALAYAELQSEAFSINMVSQSATSTITSTDCGDTVVGGFSYSFTDTVMTRVGSDSFDGCVEGETETQDFVIGDLAVDFDIPFNCEAYPVCTNEDFNKTITSGSSVAEYSYDRSTKTITYTETNSERGSTITEIIVLEGIEGAWESSTESVLFTYLPDGRYFAIQWEEEDNLIGFERGTYETSATAITYSTLQNNDGEALICNDAVGNTCSGETFEYAISSDELTLNPPDEGPTIFLRQQFAKDSIQGVWENEIPGVIFIFLPEGRYFAVQWQEEQGFIGFERGSYETTATELVFDTDQNNDGGALVCNESPEVTCTGETFGFSVSGDELTINPSDEGPARFNRLL